MAGRGGFLDDELRPAPLPALALARDAAESQHQVPGDGLRLVRGKLDPELLLDVVEPEAAVEQIRPLARGHEAGLLLVELVLDLAEQLLDRVLDRHDARRAAELVHDDRHVRPAPAHLAEEVLGPFELGHEEGRIEVSGELEVVLLLVASGRRGPWRAGSRSTLSRLPR